jgi:hypothetical protein
MNECLMWVMFESGSGGRGSAVGSWGQGAVTSHALVGHDIVVRRVASPRAAEAGEQEEAV